MTETSNPKRNSNRWFLVILGIISLFMYLSIIYKFSI